jgi:hypothetical protein
MLRNLDEQPGNSIDEEFRTDQADFGMVGGLPSQMLARTEANFEPDLPCSRPKKSRRVEMIATLR